MSRLNKNTAIPIIFQLFILLLHTIHRCDAFASMLVERQSSCWIDLRDTKTEVIMNNIIKPVEGSKHENDVRIELYDKNTMTPIEIKKVDNKRIVYIEDFRKKDSSGQIGKDEKVVLPFLLKLKVNKDAEGLGDLQYVMDAKVLPALEEDAIDKLDGTEARMTVEFTHNNGCKNQRASGRKGDRGLTLNVSIPASVFSLDNVGDHGVDVVAGWACGHEAVTLTHSIEFRPYIKDGLDSDKRVDAKGEAKINVHEEVVDQKQLGADIDAQKDYRADEKSSRNIRRRNHKKDIVNEIRERKKHNDKHHHLNLHKFNKVYSQNGFGKASFTNSSYMKGLLVFVVLFIVITKVCLAKGKKAKGRRQL